MKRKKVLLLGGSRYLLPVIDVVHRLGAYAITCDYLPDNIAHKYSDEYWDISVVDKDIVYEHAHSNHIDGIMSFACDPGVVTAAYVASKLGIPFQCSYESALILQDKGLFREFLIKNGFNSPKSKRYTDIQDAINDIDYYEWPVIVKPVDSAGSKGVTKVDNRQQLIEAIKTALKIAQKGAFIIEEFLTFEGFHSSADALTIDGKLDFITYSDQLFDSDAINPYTPAYIIWPSTMSIDSQHYLTNEIQRLMNLLGMRSGIYNIETCVANGGKPYIMEVSPRGGGCKIAEIQQMAYGIDLIEYEVRSALGMQLNSTNTYTCDKCWCEMILHSNSRRGGIFKDLILDSKIRENHLKLLELSVKSGDVIEPFTGANAAIGDMFLRFDSRQELDKAIMNKHEWLSIEMLPKKMN